MSCQKCEKKIVFSGPALCRDHFIEYVESSVKKTIEGLCSKNDHICVAASGGKDSAAVLVILKKLGYRIEALAIDEGIAGYRDKSLEDLKKLTAEYNIPLKIASFKDEVGKPLDQMVQGRYPCSVCGVFRRYLLNKYAKNYDLIATGHNLDDEAQAVMMNLIKANTSLLLRTHIKTPKSEGFVPRIKPLIFLSEKEICAYTLLLGLSLSYDECPHVHMSLRAQVRDELNLHHGLKKSLVKAALHYAVTEKQKLLMCDSCGEPSATTICRACSLKKEVAA